MNEIENKTTNEDQPQKDQQLQQQKPKKWQEPPPPAPEGMTKSQWKKQLRKQKLEEKRDFFAEKRREKKKEVRAKRREQIQNGEIEPKKPIEHVNTGVKILIDCGFDDLMNHGELVSLGNQLFRSYAVNKSAEKQAELSITSFNKRLKERFDTVMHKQHVNWKKVEFVEDEYEIDTENMIYLSSDSDNTIERLEPGKKYIVGGIVDKNRYKNLCNDKAAKQGIKAAKLPIGDFIKVSGRKVLATNHVVEILVQWLQTEDWKEAFEAVIPQRRMATAEGTNEDDNTNNNNEDSNESTET